MVKNVDTWIMFKLSGHTIKRPQVNEDDGLCTKQPYYVSNETVGFNEHKEDNLNLEQPDSINKYDHLDHLNVVTITTEDEALTTPIDYYRVEIFQTIIDQLIMSLNKRFSSNIDLITDA
ncbi:THAP-type domain-containing protein [Aphis craccivora]|uniref:THAP-type domain-containing protein n=1 Tax=Aphis craccivora TaxID=307492 RepID=A0A6G0YVY5_APHCR|nr:THAP-type domain-containing protein [Aphis craccivora]